MFALLEVHILDLKLQFIKGCGFKFQGQITQRDAALKSNN